MPNKNLSPVIVMIMTLLAYCSCLQREHTHPYDPLTTPEDGGGEEVVETPTEVLTVMVTPTPTTGAGRMIEDFENGLDGNIFGGNMAGLLEVVSTTVNSGSVGRWSGVAPNSWPGIAITFFNSTLGNDKVLVDDYANCYFKIRWPNGYSLTNCWFGYKVDDGDRWEKWVGFSGTDWIDMDYALADLKAKGGNPVHSGVIGDEPATAYFTQFYIVLQCSTGSAINFRLDDLKFY